MRSKGVWSLIAVFVLLVALAALYTLKERRPGTRAPHLSVEADSLLRIEIEKGDTTFAFERRGDRWELTGPISYPADQGALENLVERLSGLELGDVISTNPDKFPMFQVDEESGVKVKAYARDEKPLLSVILGKMGSGFQHCYLRLPGNNEVYTAAGISSYMADRGVDQWRDKTIVSFDRNRAVEVTYVYPKQRFSILREAGEWLLGKKEADSTAVNLVLGLLSDFKADGFKDGSEVKPQLTILVKLEDESEETLVIGQEDEKGKYLAKREDGETTFWIHSWKVDRLRKRRQDLLKP